VAIPIASTARRAARAAAIISTYADSSLTRESLEAQVFSGAVRLAQAA